MPYCPNCGGFHADDATYCPFCGHLVGSAPDAHAAALNAPSKVSAVFGATLRAFRHRRTLPLLLVTFVCILLQIVVFTVGLLIAVQAAFGTIQIRRIVDTHCFVRTQGLSSSHVNYKIRSHCDVFRLHPSDRALVDYRSSRHDTAEAARLDRIVRFLLDHGVLISTTGLGCLSTPIGDAEVEGFLDVLAAALRAERERGA